MDNRFATALVIGSVLSLMSVIYLSAAVGTVYWYHYVTSPVLANVSETAASEFLGEQEKANEKAYTDALYHCNGSLGLWQQCIMVLQQDYYHSVPYTTESLPVLRCVSLSFSDQFLEKYTQPGNHNSEADLIRTYLWRCQFLLPLVSLGLIFFGAVIGLAGCVCRSLYPALGTGALHLLAGVCTLGAVLCFASGVYILQKSLPPPPGVRGDYGWSFCLACVSSPLQVMAGALFLWASRASRREYSLMKAYRVA
ncbi:PREDICTED: claudin domain-containing protein 1 isoform X3 [Nanorana parkeri]|uniref:claudin domain-containing protein 1 isoform X3 n=1 Tax=Nanorana parkeri TaxID=125878 RepID=UPI000854ED1D|nr:PREDICTED: claudin domain-containing protein 1 isoform X3 [Nanorana parkeri]